MLSSRHNIEGNPIVPEQESHDSHNVRILGYDNAHGIKPVEPYEFENAGQLLEDFWQDVSRMMSED